MKKYKFYIIFPVLLIYSLISCEKNEITKTSEYFPLHVGDKWYYNNGETWEIIGIKDTLGKRYFEMSNGKSHEYYRVENGYVYSLGLDFTEYIRFNLNLDAGESWQYTENMFYQIQWDGMLYNKNDSMYVNGNLVTECYRFCYDIPEMIDDEHCVWLAPGIGIVRKTCGECLQQITDLEWAKIDGEMIFTN